MVDLRKTSRQKMQKSEAPRLNADDLKAEVNKRLAKYQGRNPLELFALFIGGAQLLEIRLKYLLSCKYGVDQESLDRSTLGQVKEQLKAFGLRGDYIFLLESVVNYRNYVATQLMADHIMLDYLLDGKAVRFDVVTLFRGTFELEQLMFLYDWCEEHDAWDLGRSVRPAACATERSNSVTAGP